MQRLVLIVAAAVVLTAAAFAIWRLASRADRRAGEQAEAELIRSASSRTPEQ